MTLAATFKRPVFYQPGRPGIIDEVLSDGRSVCFKETLEEVRRRYPGAEIGELDDVARASIEAIRRPPEEITRERYTEMLEVLPPVDWTRTTGVSSFKLLEHTYGPLTSIYVCLHQEGQPRYFTMTDFADMPHATIVRAVRDSLTRTRYMRCSCCGAATRGRQWSNRDDGYGLCPDCGDSIPKRKPEEYTPDEMVRLYGVRGVHYDVKEATP